MNDLLLGAAFVLLGPLAGALLVGLDRIISARMQGRVGPPLLQPLFDVAKLLRKQPRAINPVMEPLVLGHLAFLAAAGALFFGGGDLVFSSFVLALSALLLALAANAADSPYGGTGAGRELIALLAIEPLVILSLALVCKVAGASTFLGVLHSPVHVAPRLWGVVLLLPLLLLVKLHKSPFDLAASHHPHQEIVSGLTADLSGRLLAWVELAHWYEAALLSGLVGLFFNWSVALGQAMAALAWLSVIWIDNSTSRVRWQALLGFTWTATAVLAGGNTLWVFLRGW